MQFFFANLHFFLIFELRSKLLTFSDLKVQSVALQSKKLKFYLVFCSLIRNFAPDKHLKQQKLWTIIRRIVTSFRPEDSRQDR